MGVVLFGGFLAGSALAQAAGSPSQALGEPRLPRVVGAFCDRPACAPAAEGGLGNATGFAAAALAALWVSRRRD